MSKAIVNVSADLKLPPEVVTLATAAIGIRNSGKTNTGVVITEDLLAAGYQVIVLDPLDVWWGLKSSADGQKDGYPITVLGGAHGEVPLTETDGKVIADFLVDNPAPAILSMRHLTKSSQRRLVTEFAERLFHRKGETGKNTPVLIVVDEASQFVPQRVMGEDARMVGAIQNWVRLGRASGIGVMLIDQRPASINKDVLSQIELLIAHRVTGPQDRKALREWVEGRATEDEAKDFWASITQLTRGEAWFWSPEWLKLFQRVKVRARRTFDSSATPKLGERKQEPKKLAAADIAQLKGKLAATIEKAKADDPKELRRQISELKKEVAAKDAKDTKESGVRNQDSDQKAIDRAVLAAKRGVLSSLLPFVRQFAGGATELAKLSARLNDLSQSHASAQRSFETFLDSLKSSQPAQNAPRMELIPYLPPGTGGIVRITRSLPAPAPRPAAENNCDLTGSQRRILNAVAWWRMIDVTTPTRSQVGFVARIKPTGGHFSNTIGPLVTNGYLLNAGNGGVQFTAAGEKAAEFPDGAADLASYHAGIRDVLSSGAQQRIFDAIIAVGGAEITVEEIGGVTNIDPSGGHFSNSIGPISTLGLIDRRGGVVKPTELLFPAALA